MDWPKWPAPCVYKGGYGGRTHKVRNPNCDAPSLHFCEKGKRKKREIGVSKVFLLFWFRVLGRGLARFQARIS